MKKQLGELAANEAVWDSHTVINQVDKLKNGDLALIVDCGESDFFLDVNRSLHKKVAGVQDRPRFYNTSRRSYRYVLE